MGKMSHDRVRFTFTDNACNRAATQEAAMRAFGITLGEAAAAWNRSATIECRPSQFARFIIYRGEVVSNQAMRQFEARLVTPEACTIVDVSLNPAERF